MPARCSECGRTLSELAIHEVTAKSPNGDWKAFILACVNCDMAISAQIDPISLYHDTIKANSAQIADIISSLKDETKGSSSTFLI